MGKISLLTAPFLQNPFALTLAATYKCQSRCQYCGIWKIKNKKELLAKDFLPIWQKFPDLVFLNITGGEPFLRADLVDLIKIAWQNLPKLSFITISTNGLETKLIVSQVKKILKVYKGPLSVEISLDGEEKMHDRLRGLPGAYQKAITTYQELQKISSKNPRLKLSFSYTLSPSNAGSLEQFYHNLKEKSLNPKISLNLSQNGMLYHQDQITPWNKNSKKRLKSDITYALKMNKEIILDPIQLGKNLFQRFYLKNLLTFLRKPREIIPCQAGKASYFVDPYGQIYPCIAWDGSGSCPFCFTPCEAQVAFWKNLPLSLLKAF